MARLVDSSVFIGMERHRIELERLPDIAGEDDVALSAVSASELLVGIYRSDSSARREARESFVGRVLQAFPIIPFEIQAARVHARLSADLAAAGTPIGAHDLMIASIALANDCSILTDNVRDFDRVPGLGVIRPNWPG